MGSRALTICDLELDYAQALAFYIMNRREIHLKVEVCNAIEYAKEVDILLISDEFSEEQRRNVKAEKVIVLSKRIADMENKDIIYKFQSGEQILRQIMELCKDILSDDHLFFAPMNKKNVKIIGVYSPVHRIGKTTFALQLGEQMGTSENVLYINLELYGGRGGHFEESGQTLADVLYYLRQEKGNIGFILTKAVKHKGNLDYILPIPVSEDVKKVPAAEWLTLIGQVINQSIYETIILDIDEGIQDVYEILNVCSKIYVLAEESYASLAKIEQFENELALLGYQQVLDKLERKEQSL